MSTVFAKLNFKDHKQIVVLDSPSSFEGELAALEGVEIIRDLQKANLVTFSLAFVTTPEQINALAPAIARKAAGDAIVWFAYPKGTSKKYKSQIDRESPKCRLNIFPAPPSTGDGPERFGHGGHGHVAAVSMRSWIFLGRR